MADQQDETPDDNEELLLTEEVEPGDERSDDDEQDTNVNDEEEVPTFGDDVADEKPDDTGLVKHLRDELKRARKEAAEARRTAPVEQAIEVGEKPTLVGCEYDEEAYESQLDEWKTRKANAEKQTTERQQATEQEREAWQTELVRVAEERKALNRDDSEEAFETVKAALSDAQQAAIVQATDKGNTAKLIYALAKNPDKLTAIAGEGNLIRFIKEVTKLEGQLKMVKRRTAPAPEETQRGSGRSAPLGADKRLEKLQKEADKTGDRTALIEYKRSLRK